MTEEKIKYVNHIPFPTDDDEYDIMKYSTSFYEDDDELGTIIYLESATKYKVKICFKSFHYTFFASDESTMLYRYSEIEISAKKEGIDLLGEKGFIVESENSDLLGKLSDGSQNLYSHLNLKLHHFIIYTKENIIEIVSDGPPEISIGEIEEWENGSVVKLSKD